MNNRFVTDGLFELQAANRSPIFGYQHLPVVSLEQAIQQIIPIVPEVTHYVPLAKQNCNRTSSLLTWDESAAIYLYSMPMPFFTRLNEFLRAEDRNSLKPWFAFLKLFINALEKLPVCESIAWRGVVGDVGSAFVDNTIQVWWSVNSCSKALHVVELYLGDTGTVFAIEVTNGKDISTFSVFQQEQELILMPGSRFCVKSRSLNFKNKLFIVHLEEESASEKKKQDSSTSPTSQSLDRGVNRNRNSRYNVAANKNNQNINTHFEHDAHSRYHAFSNQTAQSNDTQMATAASTFNKDRACSIWEPQVQLNLERSVDLRCLTQKPFKARSLPKEMKYGKSEIMAASNKLLLLYADGNLHLFDENLKLLRSTIKSPISSYNLVDMGWCEYTQQFIILSKEEVYAFDPVTTRLWCIESIRLQEKKSQFVSCTCSNDKLFVVVSQSYYPHYLSHYQLPTYTFISRLTVTDLIGFDPPPENSWSTDWAKKEQQKDERKIVSVRYNQQRLGVLMEIERNTFLYALDLTKQPIGFGKIKLSWADYRLAVLAKSGEWLVIRGKYYDKFVQVGLDCQFKTELEAKNDSQSSYFSLSTGFVNLKGSVINAIMLGPSQLVLLLDDSLALYNV